MSYGANSYQYGYPEGVSITDIVPARLQHLVHEHWNKYPPVNPMWHYLLGTVYIMLGMASLIGNGTVIYLYFKEKKLRTPSNFLILNLAIFDLLELLSQFPPFSYNCFMGGVWMFSPFACEMYCVFGCLTGLGEIWMLTFITYDRYNVIVHGVSGTPLSYSKAVAMVVFTYTYGIAVSTTPFWGWGVYILEGILDSCSFDYLTPDWNRWSHGMFLFTFCYCIPLGCIFFFYITIVRKIFAHEAVMRAQAKKMNVANLRAGGGDGDSAEMRVAKSAMINVTLFYICWTPYTAIVVTGMLGNQDYITPLITVLPAMFSKTLACYNPMVYALSHPRFRAAMQEHCSWCCIHEPDGKSDSSDNKSGGTVEVAK